jgi:hypothetical protein
MTPLPIFNFLIAGRGFGARTSSVRYNMAGTDEAVDLKFSRRAIVGNVYVIMIPSIVYLKLD